MNSFAREGFSEPNAFIRENSGFVLFLFLTHVQTKTHFGQPEICVETMFYFLVSSCSHQINSICLWNTMGTVNSPVRLNDLDPALACACNHLDCSQVQGSPQDCLRTNICAFVWPCALPLLQLHPVSDHSRWLWLQFHWQCQQDPWAYLLCHLCVLCFLRAPGKQESPPCPCIDSSIWDTPPHNPEARCSTNA